MVSFFGRIWALMPWCLLVLGAGGSMVVAAAAPEGVFVCPPPDTICKGDTASLLATNPLAISYAWSPNYHITSTTISNPKVYPDTTTLYHVTITGITWNMIINGDFTMGNVGFTSAYNYTTNLWPEATYCIGPNPNTFHSGFAACGDHTTGTGNMMVVNGAGTPNTTIWQQTVPVNPNATYVFSCWLASVHSSSPAQLQFFVNGVQIGPVFTALANTCNWSMFYNTWNAGTATSAVISIRNQNTALSGNDFAIDDIYFAQLVQLYDSTLIVVEDPQISLGNDTAICQHDTITLSPGSGYSQYQWSNGAATPSVAVNAPGSYWVKVTTQQGCKAADTIAITSRPAPQITTLNDSVCPGDTAVLMALTGPGSTFLWSNGAVTSSNPVAPVATTSYNVLVTDSLGCYGTATATAVIHPLPTVTISSDTMVCLGTPATLAAGGGQFFLWTPTGNTTSTISVTPATPSATYTVHVTDGNLCTDSAAVEVTTLPYPDVAFLLESDIICKGKPTVITASGGDTYLWSTGETTPAIQVNPAQHTEYLVTVGNVSGGLECRKDTSVWQLVKNCNVVFIPNAISLSGVNKIFKPTGESLYFDDYRLAIYDRWGQLLFETHDFDEGWDGTFRGKQVPEGVYVYDIRIISGFDETYRRQGTVTVVR